MESKCQVQTENTLTESYYFVCWLSCLHTSSLCFLNHAASCLYAQQSDCMTSLPVADLRVLRVPPNAVNWLCDFWELTSNDSLVCLLFYIPLVLGFFSNSVFYVIFYLLLHSLANEWSFARDGGLRWLMSAQGGGISITLLEIILKGKQTRIISF